MKELSDKEFDQIFKNRMQEGYLEYEDQSWLKMEKKLRRRDRFVFYRNASIILLFLSFGIGVYLRSDKKVPIGEVKSVKNIKKQIEAPRKNTGTLENSSEYLVDNTPKIATISLADKKQEFLSSKDKIRSAKSETILNSEAIITNQNVVTDNAIPIAQNPVVIQNSEPNLTFEEKNQDLKKIIIDEKTNLPRKSKPISLAINVGPDFNSTKNTIGGKRGISLGIGINVPLYGNLSLQTGVNYGSKSYVAQRYDYTFNNANAINSIAGIDASCKVLEIPISASYTLVNTPKNSIDVSAGLSSYLMLKENYRFIYTEASGRKDRFLEEKNANQHYLSIIDLSATYNIKLKNRKFALGVQPYVKIPITGIGEGNVPLKSSGISLKLNYELNKKK